eukprot:921129-Pyramimonas_sp.AAC.1
MPLPSSICHYPQHVFLIAWNGALDLRSVSHVPRDVLLRERRLDPVGQLLEVCRVALDSGALPADVTN